MDKNTFQLTDGEIKLAYLGIQLLVQHGVNYGDLKPAIATDALRASLRNSIAESTDLDGQEIQEHYERDALSIVNGEWYE